MGSEAFVIAVLPGDGIGLEVIPEAVEVLRVVAECGGRSFRFVEHPIGGVSVDREGVPMTEACLEQCRISDAVLLGALGDPRFDDAPPAQRPERALLVLRRELDCFANLRPAYEFPGLTDASPLKPEILAGTDFIVVRELTGGLYYGEPRGIEHDRAYNTMVYTREEVERIAHVAFAVARTREHRVTSVDKANALEVSRFWREIVSSVATEYPDVAVEHLFVDNCAMALTTQPASFDVILTENTFGDILSDEAAVLTGSIGLLPSASIGGSVGLYEPVHGSAPDIAGRGIANPIATILSAAMLLRHSADWDEAARVVERAVRAVLERGHATRDIQRDGCHLVNTREMGSLIADEVRAAMA
ncbi:MAG: 3-isopropylmalate dehydrogenase [Planctomycetes bacterium]|nr:3-isopropylmalate dehydrogenase [Planctomycetota bacterium]